MSEVESDTLHAVYSPFAGYYETAGGGAGFTVDDGWLSYEPSKALPRPDAWRVRVGGAPGEAAELVLVFVTSGRVQFGSYAVLDSAGRQLVAGVRGGQPQNGTMWYPIDQVEAFAHRHGLRFRVDQSSTSRQVLERYPLLDNAVRGQVRADAISLGTAVAFGAVALVLGLVIPGEGLAARITLLAVGAAILAGSAWLFRWMRHPPHRPAPPIPHQFPPRPLPGDDVDRLDP